MVTPDKDFICTVCFFNFDEGFDPEKRFRKKPKESMSIWTTANGF